MNVQILPQNAQVKQMLRVLLNALMSQHLRSCRQFVGSFGSNPSQNQINLQIRCLGCYPIGCDS